MNVLFIFLLAKHLEALLKGLSAVAVCKKTYRSKSKKFLQCNIFINLRSFMSLRNILVLKHRDVRKVFLHPKKTHAHIQLLEMKKQPNNV